MTNGLTGDERPSADNAIALAAAAIGLISSIAAGSVGYEHAQSVYEAANGGSPGFNDYIEVGQAFWDALPISAAVAAMVGLLAAGQRVHASMLRFGAGAVGLVALAFGSSVDPTAHLEAYQRSVGIDATKLLPVWLAIYGPLAALLGAIGGAGIGYAVGKKMVDWQLI